MMNGFQFNTQNEESRENVENGYACYNSPSLNVHVSYDLLARMIERTYNTKPQLTNTKRSITYLESANPTQGISYNVDLGENYSVSGDLLKKLVEERAHEKFEEMMNRPRITREPPLKTKEAYTSHQLHSEADELLGQEWYKRPILSMRENGIIACHEERSHLYNCMKLHKNAPLTCRNLVETFGICALKYTRTCSLS